MPFCFLHSGVAVAMTRSAGDLSKASGRNVSRIVRARAISSSCIVQPSRVVAVLRPVCPATLAICTRSAGSASRARVSVASTTLSTWAASSNGMSSQPLASPRSLKSPCLEASSRRSRACAAPSSDRSPRVSPESLTRVVGPSGSDVNSVKTCSASNGVTPHSSNSACNCSS